MIETWEPRFDGDSTAAFFEQITVRGGTLFEEDGAVPCGLMFRDGGGQTLFFSASPTISGMYATHVARHGTTGGPAPRALGASTLQVADDTSDPTHPPFFKITASLGFASILSVPLAVGPGGFAALNFYAGPMAFFTAERQRIATVFAEQARTSVELMLSVARHQEITSNMRAAMQSRSSIDIAIGIIVAQNNCTQQEAFVILKRASNSRNIKLRHLAEDIIEQATGSRPHLHFIP